MLCCKKTVGELTMTDIQKDAVFGSPARRSLPQWEELPDLEAVHGSGSQSGWGYISFRGGQGSYGFHG